MANSAADQNPKDTAAAILARDTKATADAAAHNADARGSK